MPGALADIRVLEAGLLIQGPQAAALLADMGADVVKIELPGIGDQSRYITLAPDDPRSAVFAACNRGKRGIALDLRKARGAEIFKALVRTADVFISNFTPGTLERWGLGHDALAAVNPGIISARGSTFGPVGPDADRKGADLAGQAAGGLISTTGADGSPPTPVGAFVADHIGSLNMVAGILAALHARSINGQGQCIDVSLLGGQIWAQATEYTHYLLSGNVPGRANGGHPIIKAAYGIFETADGWIALVGVAPAARDAFFVAIDRPDLALDERFQGLVITPEDLACFKAELAAVFKTRATAAWEDAFRAAGVRYAPVRDYAQAAADPGLWANGYLTTAPDSEGNDSRVVGSPVRMSATPLEVGSPAPRLGEHTAEVLAEIGIAEAELAVLSEQGII